jgi:hypothetical protein
MVSAVCTSAVHSVKWLSLSGLDACMQDGCAVHAGSWLNMNFFFAQAVTGAVWQCVDVQHMLLN